MERTLSHPLRTYGISEPSGSLERDAARAVAPGLGELLFTFWFDEF